MNKSYPSEPAGEILDDGGNVIGFNLGVPENEIIIENATEKQIDEYRATHPGAGQLWDVIDAAEGSHIVKILS